MCLSRDSTSLKLRFLVSKVQDQIEVGRQVKAETDEGFHERLCKVEMHVKGQWGELFLRGGSCVFSTLHSNHLFMNQASPNKAESYSYMAYLAHSRYTMNSCSSELSFQYHLKKSIVRVRAVMISHLMFKITYLFGKTVLRLSARAK